MSMFNFSHILTSHKGMIPYICRHCGSNFSLKETLEGHEKTCEILFSDHSGMNLFKFVIYKYVNTYIGTFSGEDSI